MDTDTAGWRREAQLRGRDVTARPRSLKLNAGKRSATHAILIVALGHTGLCSLRGLTSPTRMNDHDKRAVDDVRMRGFAHRQTVEAALGWLDAQLRPPRDEIVPLQMAAGRVLAAPVVSDVDVPGFDRATMDGYAVVAETTEGATSYSRLPLAVIGDSLPGHPFHGSVARRSGRSNHDRRPAAARLRRGAARRVGRHVSAQPPPTERRKLSPTRPVLSISALAAVSPGKHVGRRGEDIVRGTTLFQPGRVLRPQDLGVLSSVGVGEVRVCCRPQVRLVITGNELLPSGSRPHGYRIVDANGPMLAALVARDGGLVDFPGLVPDEHDAILNALHAEADVIIVSGGSSVGIEDLAPTLLAQHGDLAIHGIAMRPSSPTGLGRIEHRLVFLLPGNPVSCLCAYDFFAGRAIRALGGRTKAWPYHAIRAQVGAQDQLAYRAAGLCPGASGRRSRRAPRCQRRVRAFIDHSRRRLRHRPRRQRRLRAWHRGGGLALCLNRSSFSMCSTATRRSGASVRRLTLRRAGSKPCRSTPHSAACWRPTSSPRSTCLRSTARTWMVSPSLQKTRSGRPRKLRARWSLARK